MKKLLLMVLLTISSVSYAKEQKTINIVLPAGPGGVATKIGMLIQEKLKDDFTVVLNYKPGAAGTIAANYTADQKSNNTTLLLGSSLLIEAPYFNKNAVQYNLEKDFVIVKNLGITPLLLVVAYDDPANSYKDLAKESRLNYISYGSGNIGGAQHIAGAIAANNLKNVIHIPYKSGAEALSGLFSGSVRFVMDSPMNINSLIKDNKLRALAILNSTRIPGYEQVPTFTELGINDYHYKRWFVLLANSNADPEDLEIIKIRLSDPVVEKELEKLDLHNSSQAISKTFLIDQREKFKKIAKSVKLD